MKKKKEIPTSVAILLMILLTLIAFGIVYLIVKNIILYDTPQYIITKEVCNNEIVKDHLLFPNEFNITICPRNLSGTCYIDIYDYGYLLVIEVNSSYLISTIYSLNDFSNKINITGEISNLVCEQQEVNELIYDVAVNWNNNTIKLWENICLDNYEDNKKECDIFPRYFTLTSKDFGKNSEWLMMFCEYYQCNSINLNDCISYKCGDYIVEVKNDNRKK